MSEFTYEALDKAGKTVRGQIEAASDQAIIERLRDLGYYPLRIAPLRKRTPWSADLTGLPVARWWFHRIRTADIAGFARELATLLDAGLPVLRALVLLRDQARSTVFRDKLAAMAKSIEAGASLSDAMARDRTAFDALFINMVRAGETGGVLEKVLERVAGFLEKREAIKGKIKSAMAYPLVVLCLAALIVTFILWKIIPVFAGVYGQLGGQLPLPTRMLIAASDLLLHRAWIPAAAIILLFWGFRQAKKHPASRLWIDQAALRLPAVGELFRKAAVARFAATLATLIDAGVPILQALNIVRDASGNEVVARAMDRVYQSGKDGETIHEPLSKCPVFPQLVVNMIAIGEETGAVDKMLNKIAETYSRQVDDAVAALASILEPVMIVLLGLIIGSVVVALYLPMFGIVKVMGNP